jgi:hypothetical protein
MVTKVEYERISKFYFPHLSDEEILSAVTYCKKVLDRKDLIFIEEFNDICFFFYESDIKTTEKSINEIITTREATKAEGLLG